MLCRTFGGVSKSMLALNKSVIKVKESQIKGFKMIFELFRKVATSPKSTPNSMTNSTIVTFNTDGKKLTDHLLATLKCCDKTIPVITRNSSILNPKLFKSSFKTLNRCLIPLTPNISNNFSRFSMVGINKPLFILLIPYKSPKFIDFKTFVVALFRLNLIDRFT